jgi:hypothetical protein
MVTLSALWLPILLSAVLVFLASSVIHMALPIHKNDLKKVPDEDAVQDAFRRMGITPGDYAVPCAASSRDLKEPAFVERMAKGPVVFMTVLPGGHSFMGTSLALWFVYCVLVSMFGGYVGGRALAPGANYLDVFRFVGTVAFACYAMSLPQASIWYKRNWGTTVRSMIDGLIYGSLTAGTFGWLWPR